MRKKKNILENELAKLTKIALSGLMMLTCINFSTISAEDVEGENTETEEIVEVTSEATEAPVVEETYEETYTPEATPVVEETVVESIPEATPEVTPEPTPVVTPEATVAPTEELTETPVESAEPTTTPVTEEVTPTPETTEVPTEETVVEEENHDEEIMTLEDDEEVETVETDYSELVTYDLTYSEDKTAATLTITLTTEDEVYLDFSNNDELVENLDANNYALNEELTAEDGKSYVFDVKENGTYNFNAEVLDEEETVLSTKDIKVEVTDLVKAETEETEEVEDEEIMEAKTESDTVKVGGRITLSGTSRSNNHNWVIYKPYNENAKILWQEGNQAEIQVGQNEGKVVVYHYYGNGNPQKYDTFIITVEKDEEEAVDGIIAYVVTASDDTTMGVNGLKIRYEDENGENITLGEGKITTFTFGNTVSINKATFAQPASAIQGYVFEDAYFFWSSHYSGLKYSATEFHNFGEQVTHYNSYLGFKCSNEKQDTDRDGYFAYNPTGVLHLVYKKVAPANPYKIRYMNGNVEYDTILSTYTQQDDGSYKYYFKATTLADPTYPNPQEGHVYTFKGWNTKADGTGSWVQDVYQDGETEIHSDIYLYAIYEDEEEKLDITVEAKSETVTYNGQEQSIPANELKESTITVDGNVYTVTATTSGAAGTDAGNYDNTITEGSVVVKDADNNDVTRKFNITLVNGSLVINRKSVTFTGNDATKVYNGETQTVTGYTSEGLVEGHEATLVAEAKGKEANTYTGTITNAEDVVIKSGDTEVTSNYLVTTKPGTLKITAKSINPDDEKTGITVNNPSDSVYDGTEHKEVLTVTDTKTDKTLVSGKDYEVSYDTEDFTNVHEITITVTGIGNYTGSFTKTYNITRRSIEITAGSASKEYDGTPLTKDSYDVTSGSVADTDTITAVTVTGSITNVGKADNIASNAVIKRGNVGATSNYSISYKKGTLTVKKKSAEQVVTITGENATVTYDGNSHTVEGYDATEIEGITVTLKEGVNAKASGTNAGKYNMGLTVDSFTVASDIYSNIRVIVTDGYLKINPQTINPGTDPENPDPAYDGVEVGTLTDVIYNGSEQKQAPTVTDKTGTALVKGTDYTVSYSGDVTNVGKVTVTVQGKGNYTGTVTRTYNITQRSIEITAASASKAYDGTPLTKDSYDVTSGSVADTDEITSVKVTGSITDAGKTENVASSAVIKRGEVDATSNYSISYKKGTLEVIAKSITPDTPDTPDEKKTGITVTEPSNHEYDGKDHKEVLVVKDTKRDETLVEGTDYIATYNTDNFKDASTITITVKGIGNYTGEFTKIYEITPREYTVTTDSASKQYDGKELTADGKVNGLVEGETVVFTITGKQTEVGSSKNTYTLTFEGTAKESNYKHGTDSIGTLEVTKKEEKKDDPKPTPTPTPNPGCPAGTVWNEDAKTCQAIVVPVTPQPTPTNTPVVTPTPSETPEATASAEPEKSAEPTPSASAETIVDPDTTPEVVTKGHWALINLVAAVVSVLLGIVLVLSKNKKDKDEDEEEQNEDENAEEAKRHKRWKVVSVIDAVLAVVVFIFTENMRLPMVLVDKWTMLMVLFALVSVISLVFGRKYHEEDEEDENQAQA